MSQNSTLKLLKFLLKDHYSIFDRSVHKISHQLQLEPKEETINLILAYSCSVKVIKTKSDNKILISLN